MVVVAGCCVMIMSVVEYLSSYILKDRSEDSRWQAYFTMPSRSVLSRSYSRDAVIVEEEKFPCGAVRSSSLAGAAVPQIVHFGLARDCPSQ